ncbi:hypothetical protein PHYC_03265 [Phycisphaerales bacterium]|nr:hypothetical protein PHYC_03265 [Phycisphaerales bacterium]
MGSELDARGPGTDAVDARIRDALREFKDGRSNKVVAAALNVGHENLRRVLAGKVASMRILLALVEQAGYNPGWLLTGQGPRRVREVASWQLRMARTQDLFRALADQLEGIDGAGITVPRGFSAQVRAVSKRRW